MFAETTQSQAISLQTSNTAQKSVRLHYLDWLRVIATLGVFLFHASNVFNVADFVIKNAETSLVVTIFQQWNAGILPKMLAVVLGGFIISLGFYELLVRRVTPLRAMFGMKTTITPPAAQPQEAAPASRSGSVTSA